MDRPLKNLLMKLNKEWHEAHRMPQNPTLDQRIEWHIEHARNCECREIPPNLREIIKHRKNKTAPGKEMIAQSSNQHQ